ncbi:malto-oligosyltrehalose synthase [Nakamurella flava]|uniref:Malto-oligosyltrehalose synthase n=1 Tax=Nakamurella flava TaxID=2576308 RepID=A0A4U6QL20_9ACTN|nr:malto-oligosyltrehalose synthase [Nakamurella flava]TKV60808.1 malto-oligosyltrehalose synthase [Nakamurella flava]
MRTPRSTYRLQITADWPLDRAAALVPYLQDLGADWVYLSPLLQSEPGSTHGYDVTDHAVTDEPRGGRDGLEATARAAHDAGLGVLVDIVPNHVGTATPRLSTWWWDLLSHGPQSRYATAFDVDWAAGHGKLVIPILGDGPEELAELAVSDDGAELRYYDHRFPIAEGTGSGTARQVHDRQHYRLVNYRRADTELNYRRFFAISTLSAVRVEDPEVFAESHAEIKHWIDAGWVDGLRIDHPDGLADPGKYLDDLAKLSGGRYVLVEKILEGDERLPDAWQCAGTTGYDALAVLDRVLVDPAGEDGLDLLDTQLRGGLRVDWAEMTRYTKRAVADGILRSEVLRLARLLPDIDGADDAVAELLSSMSVYRTYLPVGAEYLDEAVEVAVTNRPEIAVTIREVADRLRETDTEVSVRFQQTSGMVMAKGVEDCAFYRWTRLTSLTEVGAEPADFALDPAEFHRRQAERARTLPRSMTALSTHDTKRSEDTRARISVLSEIADEWGGFVREVGSLAPLADGSLANLLWQATVGAWPIERDRLHAYAEKASREAGVSTRWIDGDPEFEERMHALVDAVYDDEAVAALVAAMVDRIRVAGWSNSLALKLLQVTGPGVPDVYQGTELWDFSLVDPDNRREVDYDRRRELLGRLDSGWVPEIDESGAAKLLVTSRALRLRRDRPELFGSYAPVTVTGEAAGHLVAADRGGAVTLATRLPVGLAERGGWGDTTVAVADGEWLDALTGARFTAESGLPVGAVLQRYPVALLHRA